MNRKAIFIVVASLVSAGLVGLGAACNEIPNDDDAAAASLVLNIPAPEGVTPAKSSGKGSEVTRVSTEGTASKAPFVTVSTPTDDTWVLKITLTNPSETFYVENYSPGYPTTLTVAQGDGRVLDVQAYQLLGQSSSPPPSTANVLRAYHWYTITPLAERTLNLGSEPASVSIAIDMTETGYLYGMINDYYFTGDPAPTQPQPPFGPRATMPPSGFMYDAPLPLPGSMGPDYCPSDYYNYVNPIDTCFGIALPTVMLRMWPGGFGSAYLDNVPVGHNFTFDFFHSSTGLYSSASTSLPVPADGASMPSYSEVTLDYSGYTDPTMAVSPSSVSVPPMSSTIIYILPPGHTCPTGYDCINTTHTGGWGYPWTYFLGSSDACGGSVFHDTGYNLYAYSVMTSSDCQAAIVAYDCGEGTDWPGQTNEAVFTITADGTGGGYAIE